MNQYTRRNYPEKRRGSSVAGILAITFAILSLINLIFITTWLSYLTPLLFLIDLYFAIYWISKRDVVMIFPIVAVLSQLFPVTSFFRLGIGDIPYESPTSINVASYNIGTFWHDHLSTTNDIIAILQREDIDIVCFQEFVEDCDSLEFYKKFSCLPYYCIQNQDVPHSTRLAIFSRFPIVNSNKLIFKNNINSSMAADIEIDGKIIRVINCHLQTTGVNQNRRYGNGAAIEGATDNTTIRNEQTDAVANVIDQTIIPIILCGDFNDPPVSYSYRTINRRLRDGFKQGGKGFASTFIGGFKSLLRIDYIFNSKDFECTKYFSPDYVFSDHKMVISTLEYKTRK